MAIPKGRYCNPEPGFDNWCEKIGPNITMIATAKTQKETADCEKFRRKCKIENGYILKCPACVKVGRNGK